MNAAENDQIRELCRLAHELGSPATQLAILGEGNLSAKIDSDHFWVKASGHSLGSLTAEGLVKCSLSGFAAEAAAIENGERIWNPESIRCDGQSALPSVESAFHAWLQSQPEINWVIHTHPVQVNGLLCSERASAFAESRLFPDQVVCCGPRSCLVPYVDPGYPLAVAIRDEYERFRAQEGFSPNSILLENHGLITVGPTVAAARAATLMMEKAAKIYLNAVAANSGNPPVGLEPAQIQHLWGRPDEHHRQRILGIR